MVTAWEQPGLKAEIESSHIRQYAEFLSGTRDQVATLTGYTGNGVLLKLRASDPNATPIQVRNAADTLTVFEVNNATGLLLGGIQSGGASASPSVGGPSIGFNAQPGVGFYLYQAYGTGAKPIGVSMGAPNQRVTIGPVPASYLPYVGGIDVTLQPSGVSTIDQVQAGITVTQGSASGGASGGPNPVRAQGPAVSTYSVIHMEGQERIGVAVTMDAASGPPGGPVYGAKFNVGIRGDYGASAPLSSRGVTGVRIRSNDSASMTGPAQGNVVSGMLIASQGNRTGDLVQGIELVTSSAANVTLNQRLNLILATEDAQYSRKGTSIDAFLVMGRKGWPDPDPSGHFGTDNVAVFDHGMIFGGGDGGLNGWPFDGASHAICFDHKNPANAGYNICGTAINLGATGFAQGVIVGGSGQWGGVFNFPGVTVASGGNVLRIGTLAAGAQGLRFDTVQSGSYPIRVGTVFGVSGDGYLGMGLADPAYPMDILVPAATAAMRLQGAFINTTGGTAVPANVARWMSILYHNGSAYVTGRIPIF